MQKYGNSPDLSNVKANVLPAINRPESKTPEGPSGIVPPVTV